MSTVAETYKPSQSKTCCETDNAAMEKAFLSSIQATVFSTYIATYSSSITAATSDTHSSANRISFYATIKTTF